MGRGEAGRWRVGRTGERWRQVGRGQEATILWLSGLGEGLGRDRVVLAWDPSLPIVPSWSWGSQQLPC